MPTIKTEAHDLLARAYQLDELGCLPLGDAKYSHKLSACISLATAARTLLLNAEKRCNGIQRWDEKARMVLASWTDEDEAKAQKSDEKAEDIAKGAIATLYGANWPQIIDLEFQGDPRGAMIKVWPFGKRDVSSPLMVV